jgi:hypothetical protein
MKVTRTKPASKVTKQTVLPQTTRNAYKGIDDPAFFIHHNKTHRSMSEAFRDADYATAFYREKSDWDDFVLFCKDGMVVLPMLFVFAGIVMYVVR